MINLYSIDYDKFNDYAASLCQCPYSIWLDSSDISHKNGNFSFFMAYPLTKINNKNGIDCLFEYLKNHALFSHSTQKELLRERQKHESLPPFIGGFAGFISYDYGVKQRFNLPHIPQNINMIPQFYGGLYDVVFYANHQTQQAGIIALNIHPNQTPSERVALLLQKAQQPIDIPSAIIENIDIPESDANIYRDNVNKTIDYILKGDIFQANIAHSVIIKRPSDFMSFAFYHHLRQVNAAPFGCYIQDDEFQIMSSSPERFLKVNNRVITTEPIKGTIKSASDIILDIEQKEKLLKCPKNRAENMIIVDLLRNDITPYAKTGTINAEKLCELQTFKGLHHLVSTITAKMHDDACVLDVLKTALPGGSITGAPKKRVCEIIYELEKSQRGAYCGSAGYIGFDGYCDMNILIRTIQADKQSIVFHSGCGITAQSNAEAEWHETQTKSDKIIQSLMTYTHVLNH